nr:receptor-like protein 12 [Ipomoea batatas]
MMIRCVERERQALLDFKQSLVDEDGVVSSWGSDDECCNWWGVHCNNNTGHITVLDLHPTRLNDYGYPIHQQLRSPKVSPSLLELRHLSYLDLSYIDFQGSRIPEFIGSFDTLQVLKLMYANFSGTIPPHFGNLTNLQILNITASDLIIKNLGWLSHLSSLRSIYLDDIEIDLTDQSPETSVTLPPLLEVLQMPRCQLIGTLPFTLNSSSLLLSVLDFSENTLTSSSSSVFHFLSNASKQLTSIDLSRNNFTGPIPDSFGDMKFLESLNLRLNSFMDGIPKSFENLTHLQTLDLTKNKLIGELPANISAIFPSLRELYASENQLNGSIFELPSCLEYLDLSGNKIKGLLQDMKCPEQECDLMYLDLSKNQITGQFPDLSHFSSLREIHLFGNQITGYFPDLSHAPSLRVIDFSGNKLQGGLPETIGKLSKLEKLFASSNSLEGVVTEAHFSNLSKLQSLDLSFNVALSFNLSSNWVPPFLLYDLILANCKIGPQFPKWLQTQSKIVQLDFSSGGILDVIPDWFWNSSQNYNSLNLSYNQIEGRLPDLSMEISYLQVIDLSSNNFWGPISTFVGEVPVFHLSNNRFVGSISFLCESTRWPLISILSIDLSNNQLSGEIPDCWDAGVFSSLSILNLANNNFFGRVPLSLGSLSRLQSLHLRNNNLTEELPSSLQNCTSLRVMDFGGNKFTGRIPSWIGMYLTNLVIVSLRHNKFYGKISSTYVPPQSKINDYQEGDGFMDRGFYISMVLGFSLSFWGIVVTLVLKNSWRIAYYKFLNDIKDWFYVKVKIYLGRLQQKLRCT